MSVETQPRDAGRRRRRGAERGGAPEDMKTAIVGGQLARRLSAPYRSSNANAANALDAQAAYESVFSLWGAIMGGVNFLMHGAETWREAGSPTAAETAERAVAERLRDFGPPPFEPERREALAAFVARRKADGGAPTDY
jgi:trimethylamine:corrinoid methyltransferase-like protein